MRCFGASRLGFLWPYQAEHSVELVALTVLPVAAVFAVFDGAQVVLFGVLRGVGDTFLRVGESDRILSLGGALGVVSCLYVGVGTAWNMVWARDCIGNRAHLLVLRLAVTARRGGTLLS